MLDIETSPIQGYTWTTWDANVLKIIESSKLLSVAWKFLGSEDLSVKALCDYKGYKPNVLDDRALVTEIWHVLDKADIVIGHHSDAFDLKKLNARFVYYDLNSPTPYLSVDTKKVASKYFKFDSNSLNNLGAYLNLGKKIENGGFDLWVRCMAGDPEAWELMKTYNSGDVYLLEKIYFKLRPFIANHPDLNTMTDVGLTGSTCSSCLSINLTKRGFSLTKIGRKQRYQCGDCGSWSVGSWQRNKTDSDDSQD